MPFARAVDRSPWVRSEAALAETAIFSALKRDFIRRNHIRLGEVVGSLLRAEEVEERITEALAARDGLAEAADVAERYSLAKKQVLAWRRWCADLESNTVERAIGPLALTRKNSLFASSDGGEVRKAGREPAAASYRRIVRWRQRPTEALRPSSLEGDSLVN